GVVPATGPWSGPQRSTPINAPQRSRRHGKNQICLFSMGLSPDVTLSSRVKGLTQAATMGSKVRLCAGRGT
ncbi:hypothetical protein NPIL_354281, partial [Nephila pilipes]